MIARNGEAFAVRGRHLLRWSPSGYAEALPRPHAGEADVLTPPAMLNVLGKGYLPQWHPDAEGALIPRG